MGHTLTSTVSPRRSRFRGRTAAIAVVAGTLLSKFSGVISARVFAHYFGLSEVADCFRAAFRVPAFLHSAFGEGVLSASFIPVYARLRALAQDEQANRLALAVFACVTLGTTILVAAGIAGAPALIALVAPGFTGAKRDLTVQLLRIAFPATGLLVFSAWCLAVLNSHGKFFLSYAAPALWDVAMIAVLLWYGSRVDGVRLVKLAMWGAVAGSALQLAVQLPFVWRLLHGNVMAWGFGPHLRTVGRNFLPVLMGRGVVQISMYVTTLLASLLPTGAVAALANAGTLYLLPLTVFGVPVYATELPAMSGQEGTGAERCDAIQKRLAPRLHQIAYFVVPSAVAFIVLGDVIVRAVYLGGGFTVRDVVYVWAVLAGYSVGLTAEAATRLFLSAYYALGDTRTPLLLSVFRVVLTVAAGYLLAFPLRVPLGVPAEYGAALLTLAVGLTSCVELAMLRRGLRRRFGIVAPAIAPGAFWMATAIAAAVALAVKAVLPHWPSVLAGIVVLGAYALVYLGTTHLMGISILSKWIEARRMPSQQISAGN